MLVVVAVAGTLAGCPTSAIAQDATGLGPDLERELRITELQRQIDVATGKITPEQARKAAETERLNVLTTEVARLRKETDSPRTASKEEVERLRQMQGELRQLEVAAGRMTPQEAQKAAEEDRVRLLRAEQNALRNEFSQRTTKGTGLELELKISELQRKIDVATGKITPEQARKAAETERLNVLTTEVARLRKETDSPRTASKEEVERLRQLQGELRQIEVAAGRMTPQQAQKAAEEDRLRLLRAEQNALRNEFSQRTTKGTGLELELKISELQRQIDVATGKITPEQARQAAETERLNVLTTEVARLRKETDSPRTASKEEVERLRQMQGELRQLEVAAGRMTPQQAEKTAEQDRIALMRAEQNALRNEFSQRTIKGTGLELELKISELQRQIDVATGKITPEQARQAAETERLNVLTTEVARLRKETDSPRTASKEEVERLRQMQGELRQLEVAAGRMTPQQAEKAAEQDRIALLRAEQNALRGELSRRTTKGTGLELELKISELQRQIDVATGKITPEQARQAAETERLNVLTTEVARLRKETDSPRTASKEEVERLRQLQGELRQLEVAAGRMTPQQAQKAAEEDRVRLLRAEQNALRGELSRRTTKGTGLELELKISELQRQIDVATGKITPEQARQRAETERLNVLTTEVARLRKETDSPRTASKEEVERLRQLLNELRQLEVATGRMTQEQADKAAAADRVTLLRAEQNALRNERDQRRTAKGRDPEGKQANNTSGPGAPVAPGVRSSGVRSLTEPAARPVTATRSGSVAAGMKGDAAINRLSGDGMGSPVLSSSGSTSGGLRLPDGNRPRPQQPCPDCGSGQAAKPASGSGGSSGVSTVKSGGIRVPRPVSDGVLRLNTGPRNVDVFRQQPPKPQPSCNFGNCPR